MLSKGNYPQMAEIHVSEILTFPPDRLVFWCFLKQVTSWSNPVFGYDMLTVFFNLLFVSGSVSTTIYNSMFWTWCGIWTRSSVEYVVDFCVHTGCNIVALHPKQLLFLGKWSERQFAATSYVWFIKAVVPFLFSWTSYGKPMAHSIA